ncbi:MAG TPA: DUF951 domain-containing protein [Thermomicrobiales bacterium]|nr:DUF951 domain-containing protein [Thermomicrobiales bacterium]
MPSAKPLQVFIGDVVRLRKPHPCGSHEWTVVRLGADIGLRCHGCNRRVLLPRRELERRLKAFVSRGPEFAATPADDNTSEHPETPAT